MSLSFDKFDVSPTNFHPHEPCSHCSSPYHSLGDCLHWGQFSNFSHEQMNTNFSSLGFESNSNFYNLDWSNHFGFSWQAHAAGNYAPQVDGLHHPDYLQFDNQFSSHSSYDYPPKQSSLEETLKEFMELVSQPTIPTSQELSLEDTLKEFMQIVARLEGQFGHLVAEFNIIEEENFQSQELARSEEVFKETANEPSLEYPTLEEQTEKGETTEISFPNSFSLVAEPYILNNHSSLPSLYTHPPQESLVQHFPSHTYPYPTFSHLCTSSVM
jgi:exonuclease VII small subunit